MTKYQNKPVEFDGFRFDSLAEAGRYQELRLLEQAGEISGLVVHPKYILQEAMTVNGEKIRAITYSGDFQYFDHNGMQVCEDVKGFRTKEFIIKRKLFIARYPAIRFVEVSK